ncbi:MAG: DUF58 domain-containing protein [SAR324 cluster bacterium]|nr:DUF58 domain-containing protein [SAR324 cluster bacterium]
MKKVPDQGVATEGVNRVLFRLNNLSSRISGRRFTPEHLTKPPSLQSPELLRQFNQLHILLAPSVHERQSGFHLIHHKGQGLEFEEYREYRQGDNIRDLDWKVLGRTNRLYVKQKDRYNRAKVLVLVDNSRSMLFQSASAPCTKFHTALLLGFSLSYVLYRQGDAFSLSGLYDAVPPSIPASSKKRLNQVTSQLSDLRVVQENPQDFTMVWSMIPPVDHLFVVSDFLVSETELSNWAQMAGSRARDVTFFRILDAEEVNPVSQTSEYFDLETPELRRQITHHEWKTYQKNFERHASFLSALMRQYHFTGTDLMTQEPFNESIRGILSRTGRGVRSRLNRR